MFCKDAWRATRPGKNSGERAKPADADPGTMTMPKLSAGILLFRRRAAGLEVMLVHPGGPFWAKKDEGAWSIPKGLADEGEDLLAAAKREFLEETGMQVEGAVSRPWRAQAAKRQDDRRLGVRGRFRSGNAEEQHILARMASAFGTNGGIPGGRPGRVVFDRRGAREDKQGAEANHRGAGSLGGSIGRPIEPGTERPICGLPFASAHETRAAQDLFLKRIRTWRSGWTSPPFS